jgi:type II secretory pathway pseudopilin PulG
MSSTKRLAEGRRPDAAGFTLVELLVTIAILIVLVGLLVPAVQSARESARVTSCRNNVRQVAVGLLQHEQSMGFFPSGGWGPGWLGVAERGSDPKQPGSWIYSILPAVEAADVHRMIANAAASTSAAAYRECAASAVPVFACPSRRTAAPRQLPASATYRTPFDTALTMTTGVVSDYVANGGSTATCPPLDVIEKALAYVDGSTKITFCHVPNNDPTKQNTQTLSMSSTQNGHDGHDLDHYGPCFTCDDDMATVAIDPNSLSQGDQWRQIQPYGRIALPDGGIPDMQDGVVARMSQVRAAMIRDGLSNTYLVGEKYVAADRYATASDAGDDRVMIAGYSSSTVRWAYDPPAKDAAGVSQPNVFGSAHRAGWTAAFADGSVTSLGFDIAPAVHKALAGRADGLVFSRPD